MTTLSYGTKMDYCADQAVTLNGKRAFVCGAKEQFATVRTDDGFGHEFSWPAVQRVMETTKAFRS